MLVLSACNSTPELVSKPEHTDIIQLIEQAKRRFPEGIIGTFQIPIKASASHNGITYLNSNVDYRAPTNITVVLTPETIELFAKTYHSPPDLYFKNKTLSVTGKVERIKMYKYENNKRTKQYYFQTHIRVTSIDQLKVLS